MGQGLEIRNEDGVVLFGIARDPGRLTPQVRRALIRALKDLENDDALVAAVITGAGRGFPAGPALEELEHDQEAPDLAILCDTVAGCPKPVVAAMRGHVRGGGAELALAAHARIAVTGTRISISDVMLGALPIAGATQRLARLVGASATMDFLIGGQPTRVEEPDLAGLCDAVVGKNVVGAALDHARALAGDNAARTVAPGLADPLSYQDAIARRRADDQDGKPQRQPPEVTAIVDCVEAAQLLPLSAGIAFEQARRKELLDGPRAPGLFHIARAERRAVSGAVAPVSKLTLFGDGRLSGALTLAALDSGMAVTLAEGEGAATATQTIRRVGDVLRRMVEAGRLDGGTARQRMARLTKGAAADVLPEADCVIECTGSDNAAMTGIADLLSGATTEGVPVCLTSNTGLFVESIAPLLRGRVVAAAFQPPAHVSRLVELVAPEEADERAVMVLRSALAGLGKSPVVCAPVNGLILQRLVGALFAAAEFCVLDGAQPWDVDRALGWNTGPFGLIDHEGIGAQLQRLKAIDAIDGAGSLHEAMLRDIGSEAQFYRKGEDGALVPNPDAEDVVRRWRGTVTREMPDRTTIQARIVTAMLSTGATMIETGDVGDAGEIDLVAVHGLHMPRATGGPMHMAQTWGLLTVQRLIERFSPDMPALWRGSPVIDDAIRNGSRFPLR